MRPPQKIPFSLAFLAIAALVASATGQDEKQFRAFLSTKEKGLTIAEVKGTQQTIRTRPNNESFRFVYVANLTKDATPGKVNVYLTKDKDGKKVLASGSVAKLDGMATALVELKSTAVEPPPPAVPVPAPEKPAAPPTDAKPILGTELAEDQLWLHVRDEEDKDLEKPEAIDIRLLHPSEYILPKVTLGDAQQSLTIELAEKEVLDPKAPPARVKLEFRPDLVPNIDKETYKLGGTFETLVRPGAKNLRLMVKNLKFVGDRKESIFSLSVDGYDRAFVYRTDFGKQTEISSTTERLVGLECPAYAIPGKPISARLEVYNDPKDGKPQLTFQRADGADPEELTKNLETPRDQKLTFRIGKTGEIIVASYVKDWIIPLDTAGVYGKRDLKFALLDKDSKPLAQKGAGTNEDKLITRTITLDDTPPVLVDFRAILPMRTLYADELDAFLKAPRKPPVLTPLKEDADAVEAERNKDIFIVASVADAESGINLDTLRFWIGEPPAADGKPPANGKVLKPSVFVPTIINPKTKELEGGPVVDGIYFAKFRLPQMAGKTKVGVIFANNVGLIETRTVDVIVIDPPEKPTTGTLEGRVIQGSTPERPQPNLPVTLFDEGGKPVKSDKTNAKGEFKFTDLKPGSYSVFSVKEADTNAKDVKTRSVAAGRTTKVELELKR